MGDFASYDIFPSIENDTASSIAIVNKSNRRAPYEASIGKLVTRKRCWLPTHGKSGALLHFVDSIEPTSMVVSHFRYKKYLSCET